jgi:hypothetical protein
MLTESNPENAKHLWAEAQHDADARFAMYEYLAQRKVEPPTSEPAEQISNSN